jgi:pyridoxamine 5'-phosphate oxidase
MRRVVDVTERFADAPVPRPPHWGGFRLSPVEVEFWQGRPNRLHDRFRYRRDEERSTGWKIERLAP